LITQIGISGIDMGFSAKRPFGQRFWQKTCCIWAIYFYDVILDHFDQNF